MHELFKEKFKSLALSFSEVERAIGCPKNYLSRHINGASTLPSKWEIKINEYLAQFSRQIVTAPAEWQEKLAEKYAVDFNPLKEMGDRLALFQQLDQFCDKRGFPLSELIGKFQELEDRLNKIILHNNIPGNKAEILAKREGVEVKKGESRQYPLTDGQNKPIPDLEIEKESRDSQKQGEGQEKAKKRLKFEYEGTPLTEKDLIGIAEAAKSYKPAGPEAKDGTKIHPLWKKGDPKENTGAFYLKYGCNNYEELSKLKK